jgi:hypothetical protein
MARRAVFALLAFAVATSALGAQAPSQDKPGPPAKVAGTWATTLEMEVGVSSITLVFEQDAAKPTAITGSYQGRYGKYPLVGTVTGKRLDFVVTINAEGTETQMTFTGEVDAAGEVIKGSANLGGMGDAGWIAKLKK